jgi:hypothetical protein
MAVMFNNTSDAEPLSSTVLFSNLDQWQAMNWMDRLTFWFSFVDVKCGF